MSRWWIGAVLLLALPASAAEPLAALLPAGELQGDGVTAHVVHLLMVDENGAPASGLRPKVKASLGSLGKVSEIGQGIYAVDWTPPEVESGTEVVFSVSGKTSAKASFTAQRTYTIGDGARASVTATANPADLTLGRTVQATLSLEVFDAKKRPVSGAAFAVETNFGSVQTFTDMGGGRYTARYDATEANFPHVELLTVADWTDPANVSGYLAIPVQGSVNYPVEAPEGSNVIMRIGDREYGPTPVGANGVADVPVVVPPGTQRATAIIVKDGERTERTIDLLVPETQRLGWFPVPVGIPADPSRPVSLRVAVVNPDGSPDESAKLALSASVGELGAAVPEGGGVYRVMYLPPLLTAPGSAVLTVSLGASKKQVDAIELPLLPARPGRVTVSSEPEFLADDAKKASLRIGMVDAAGEPLKDQMVRVLGEGITVDDLSPGSDGSWTAKVSVSGDGAADVVAAAPGLPTGNPLAAVVLLPDAGSLAVDGGVTGLTVLTVDAFGFPVPDVPVSLSADGLGLKVKKEVRTDPQGLARTTISAGDASGLVTLTGEARGSTGAAAVLQLDSGAALPVLPVSGHTADLALRSSLQQVVVAYRLRGPGAGGVPVVAAPVPVPVSDAPAEPAAVTADAVAVPQEVIVTVPTEVDPEGALVRLEVVVSPAPTPAGADAKVTVVAWTATDKGAPGLQLVLMPEDGDVSELVDVGDGTYTATWSLPRKASGALRLTAATSEGMISRIVTAEIAEPAGKTKTPKTPREKTPREPSEAPWLRASAGPTVSSYRYLQVPYTSNGPLLPQAFAIGGDYGSNATPGGFFASASGFVPDLPYVGGHAQVDLARTQVTTERFGGDVVSDTLLELQAHAVGRYPFQVAGSTFHVGARVGFRLNDIMVWEGSLDDNSLEYRTLMLPSLDLGLEGGVEVGSFHALAAIGQGLAYATTPASTSVDVGVGYDLVGPISVEAGFSHRVRDVRLEGTTTDTTYGTLSDGWTVGRVGVGVKL